MRSLGEQKQSYLEQLEVIFNFLFSWPDAFLR